MADNLNSIFSAVVFKTLVLVDLPQQGSHQHEINGVGALKGFFKTEQQISGFISWHYFSDDAEPLQSTGDFTFYDARAKSAARTGRSEWRMYYKGDFLSYATTGDVLVLARTLDGAIFGLIFQNDSGWLRAAKTLFQFEEVTPNLQLITTEDLQDQELEFVKRQILDELNLEVQPEPSIDDSELAAQELSAAIRSGIDFPTTRRMSDLAQSLVDVDYRDTDNALLICLDREEKIFKAIEKIIVEEKIRRGFSSVDEFVKYSLSVQNRRKSRMGFALQNHLDRIFQENRLRFNAQVYTEGKNKPDFLFPGKFEYDNALFSNNGLDMLAVKSSCKDRWRQVLDEADRISLKHLFTLEQAISVNQTNAMFNRSVRLVIPERLHSSYSEIQQKSLLNLDTFVDYIKRKQS